jgi:hypothetical protein
MRSWQDMGPHVIKGADIRAHMKEEVRKAWLRIIDQEALPQPPRTRCLRLCTTCFGRGYQLKCTLPVNCSLALCLPEAVKICVVTFGDDVELLKELAAEFWYPIEKGVLRLASGGLMGLRSQEALPQTMVPAELRLSVGSSSSAGTPPSLGQASMAPEAHGRPP